jgi:serine palmitoyltransferase
MCAHVQDEYCTPRVLKCLARYSASSCSNRENGGTSAVHAALEAKVAKFLGKEACMVLGMGYATNSAVVPALCGKGDLIISDALNHSSIVSGARGTGSKVSIFKHNDASHLDRVLRQAIAGGQSRTHRPWRKILVIVEGIYSMEGEVRCCRCAMPGCWDAWRGSQPQTLHACWVPGALAS